MTTAIKSRFKVNSIIEASDGEEAIAALKSHKKVDLVLLDINMPKCNGIDVLKFIKSYGSNGSPKVIALTAYSDQPLIDTLADLGIHGFLQKGCNLAELVLAIEAVFMGDSYGIETSTLSTRSGSPKLELSTSEKTLLSLIGKGMTSREIARNGKTSVRTVETQRRRLEKKLNVRNSSELIDFAYRNALLRI